MYTKIESSSNEFYRHLKKLQTRREREKSSQYLAEGSRAVYDAIKNADPDEKLVQLKSLEALKEVAKGEANKIFIPFEATGALGSLGAAAEALKQSKPSQTQRPQPQKLQPDPVVQAPLQQPREG